MNQFARSKADGLFYEPSYPDGWTDADAVAACLNGTASFYFRQVVLVKRVWPFRPTWKRTGVIWQPKSGEFEVLPEYVARAIASASINSRPAQDK